MHSFPPDHTLHSSEADPLPAASSNTPHINTAERRQASARAAQTLVVTATFTADPLADVLDFWLGTLDIAATVEFAPYQQVFQQLLDPESAISRNHSGINVLLVRWEDWQQRDDQRDSAGDVADRTGMIAEHARQFVSTLKTVAARSSARFLVCLCPATPTADPGCNALYDELNAFAQTELEPVGNVWLLSGAAIQARYPVADYYDAHSDALGHIPFTPHFFTALGTTLTRTISGLLHPPTKVVVLDCDHTLWGGVVGEDGPLGIVLDEPRLALQRFIVALHDAGMLICLCSKNSEEDVIAVFEQRSDMLLTREHLVAWRINWRAKSENLQSLAAELQLGLDSFIFLDDNPLECAEVQASCPEVLALQIPADTSQIAPFLNHVWAFDRTRVTAEDTRRTAMYQQNLARERARSTALTLEDFLADLRLDIRIVPLTPPAIPRVAQLTQRTNQFNLTTIRRSEGEIQAFCQAGGTCWTVEVSDRFGDYGLVGVLLFTSDADAISVDTWLLSCRVLGKRVEHHMLARLGELAQEQGLSRVNLRYVTTSKNQPARDFAESVGGEFKTTTDDGAAFSLPSAIAATILAQRISTPRPVTDVVIAQQDVTRAISQPIAAARSRTALMQQIGMELQSVAQIHAAIAAQRLRSREALGGTFVAPETETERQLSAIWTEVLDLDRVGRHDSFFALGGQSLLGTRLLSRVRSVFQVELSQIALFEAPTLAELATRIEQARGEQTTGSASPSIPKLARQTPTTDFSVSFAQQRLWFLEQLQANGQAYNDSIALQLTGALNVALLEAGLNTIIQRHETLRTTFPIEGATVVQRVGPAQTLKLTEIDLLGTAADREGVLIDHAQQQLAQPFDLAHGPLFRATLFHLGDQEHLLLMWMQHIVSDGWSWGVLCRELSAYYRSAIAGTTAALPELPIQYADYAVWQREYLQGSVRDAQLNYWRQQLADLPVLELPTDHPRPAVTSPAGASLFFQLPADLTAALSAFTQREGVTLFMTGLAAFQVLLARYSRQTDLAVGTPIANRTRHETEDLIGCFVNTLVLRSQISLRDSFRDLLQQVRAVALDAYAHQDVPFEEVVDALQPERDLSRHPLFQVMFVLQNAPLAPLSLPEVTVERFPLPSTTSKFDLTLTLEETAGGISGDVEFSTALFDRTTIERLVEHFQTLLRNVIAEPERPLLHLPMSDERPLLAQWNATNVPYPIERPLQSLFEDQVARTPDAPALVFEHSSLSYREMDQQANQVAHLLRKLGVTPNTLVSLCLERSLEMFVGMFGVLKSGAAFLPLDAQYPAHRLEYMINDSNISVMITNRAALPAIEALVASQPQQIRVLIALDHTERPAWLPADVEFYNWADVADYPIDACPMLTTPEDLVYLMYTSGSTGQPKGVPIRQRNLVQFFQWNQDYFEFRGDDRIIQYHTISFDFSTWEIFEALLVGASLHIVSTEVARDVEALADYIAQHGITVLNMTPSQFTALADFMEHFRPRALDTLRIVVLGGEMMPTALARRALKILPPTCRFYNEYGPTETTISCAIYLVTPEVVACYGDHPSIPFGGPIANTQLYVLDAQLYPVPTGVPGELYIGGFGQSGEYFKRPDLTADRYVPDPFSAEPGRRLYKSGDVVRWLPEGIVEFLGRGDHQVKLRGYRIELGEIELLLASHPDVREAVVIVHEDRSAANAYADKRLVAYVVPTLATLPTTSELRDFMLAQVPEYMIPAVFVPLKELPLTANGKLDRKALPVPDLTDIKREEAFVAPRTPAEEVVAQIWARLLRIEQISVHDNFFELGGNSLLATQVIVRLHEIFPINVPVRSMFDRPTVAGLVEALVTLWGQADALDALNEIATIYQQMENLSEDEVRALLMAQD
ncbi:MAG: amino acid adenylation domain-containing protein [Chloroflexi bacterium]|nr:amino acid adenylation domain-containing protein [Chloroflexota bacterium]